MIPISLSHQQMRLFGFTNNSWASCSDDQRAPTAMCFLLVRVPYHVLKEVQNFKLVFISSRVRCHHIINISSSLAKKFTTKSSSKVNNWTMVIFCHNQPTIVKIKFQIFVASGVELWRLIDCYIKVLKKVI